MNNLSELEMRKDELLYDLEKLDEEINKIKMKYKKGLVYLIYEDDDLTLTEESVDGLYRSNPDYMILVRSKNTENFIDISSDGYHILQVAFSKGTLTRLSKAWLEYIEKENKNAQEKN